MICVTGQESETGALLERLQICGDHLLQEVRLDTLRREIPNRDALPVGPEKLVVSCRRAAEGGAFTGSEEERWVRLEKALDWRPGWIDLEADLPDDTVERLARKAEAHHTRVLRSLRLAEDGGPGFLTRAMAELVRLPGDGIHLEAPVEDVIRLEEFLQAPRTRPFIKTGLGPAGLASRILAPRFHSEWTWISATPPGDRTTFLPDLKTAREWGMPVSDPTTLFAVIGDLPVMAHPTPPVLNHLFRSRDYHGVCLPIVTEHVEAAFLLLCNLGLEGLSIQRPYKSTAFALCSEYSLAAGFTRSVNVMYKTEDGAWRGENTDIPSVQALVDRLGQGKFPEEAVILGTGALAVTSAYALSERGVQVTLLGRNTLLEDGPWITSLPMEAITEVSFDLLIQATPMGERRQDPCLVPDEVDLRDKMVIDAVLATTETPLLKEAKERGARTANGTDLWAEQCARKLELFHGPSATPGQLAASGRDLLGLA